MKIKAEMGHWSSVVGGGVHLIGPKGNMIGQIAFLCHTDELRGKDVQMALAKACCDAINAMGDSMTAPDTSPDAIAALLDGVTPGPWVTDEESEGHGWGVSWRIVQSGNWLNDIAEMVNEQDARFIAAARELVPALSAERDRLSAQVVQLQRDLDAAHARAVKVKPLVWEKDTLPHTAPQRYVAKTYGGFGDYSVSGSDLDKWQWFRNGYFVDGHQHHEPMPIEAAKAAAKADYEARILSALEKPHD